MTGLPLNKLPYDSKSNVTANKSVILHELDTKMSKKEIIKAYNRLRSNYVVKILDNLSLKRRIRLLENNKISRLERFRKS